MQNNLEKITFIPKPLHQMGTGKDFTSITITVNDPNFFSIGDVLNLGQGSNARILAKETIEDYWEDISTVILQLVTNDPNEKVIAIPHLERVISAHSYEMLNLSSIVIKDPV